MVVIRCASCGTAVDGEAERCPTCGAEPRTGTGATHVAEGSDATGEAPGNSERRHRRMVGARRRPAAAESAPSPHADADVVSGCPQCGLELTETRRFCPECGYAFDVAAAPQASSPSPPPSIVPPVHGVEGPSSSVKRRSRLVIAIVVVAVVLLAVAAAVYLFQTCSKSSIAGTHTIKGTLSAPDKGYDIANASVEVRDESGDIVATGYSSGYERTESGDVQVTFAVDVPKRKFYTITVGTHEGPSYSFDELESNGWQLDLTLGD